MGAIVLSCFPLVLDQTQASYLIVWLGGVLGAEGDSVRLRRAAAGNRISGRGILWRLADLERVLDV